MALCYDDSREVMGLQECVRQAMELISVLQKESVSPAAFLKRHAPFFSGIPLWSLLAPECRQKAVYTESSYVYLIGSYGAKTVCCLSVTLGILSENIVQQLEKAISDIAGIAGIPFTDAVINQYHNF